MKSEILYRVNMMDSKKKPAMFMYRDLEEARKDKEIFINGGWEVDAIQTVRVSIVSMEHV